MDNQVCGTKDWAECKAFLQKHLDKDSIEYKQLQDVEESNDSPLGHACLGHIELIKVLLRNGIPVDQKYDKDDEAMLHEAADEGHNNLVTLLLTHGANIHVKDSSDSTPLHRAIRSNHLSTVKLLLDSGADVNIKDGLGQSPLYLAVSNFFDSISELYYFIDGAFLKLDDEQKNKISVSKKTIIDLLLECRADTNIAKADGYTPLHVAARYDESNVIVKLLVERGANINATNDFNQTPLHVAAESDNLSVVEYLVTMGCDKTIISQNEETALDIAKKKKLIEIIDILSQKEQ